MFSINAEREVPVKTKRTGVLIGAVAAIAIAGGGAIVMANGATADDEPRILAQSEALPAVVRNMIADPDSSTAEFGLDPSKAMKFPLRSSNGDAWVTPGAKGVCVWDVDGAGVCASNEDAARRGVVLRLVEPNHRPGERPAPDAVESATFIGYVPADVTEVAILDDGGTTIARATPFDRVFDLEVKLPARSEMQLQRASKDATSIPLSG